MAIKSPIPWPCDDDYWWMEYQRTKRSKKRVLLVRRIEHEGAQYIQPHEDRKCYSRSIVEEWNTRFIPCETPPVFPPVETEV